jgi:molybdopterin-guanine dinucleotide biosynthesis protein A
LPHRGCRFIEGIYRTLSELFEEVILVTNTPEHYQFLPCLKVPDVYPGKGVLAGIHAGLLRSKEPAIFVVACDMPYLNGDLIRHLTSLSAGVDLVYPLSAGGFEPLHSLYGKDCLPELEELLQSDERRVKSLLPRVRVREVPAEEVALFDPDFKSFININTPDDYYKLRSAENEPTGEEPTTLRQSS